MERSWIRLRAQGIALGLCLIPLSLLAGCGGGEPSAEDVARAEAAVLHEDDFPPGWVSEEKEEAEDEADDDGDCLDFSNEVDGLATAKSDDFKLGRTTAASSG